MVPGSRRSDVSVLERMSIDLKPDEALERPLASRRAWLVAALLLALHVIVCWLAREPGVMLMRDDARYLILASSIAQGGYNDLFLTTGAAHSLYPPVFPALLRTWGSIVGSSFDSFVAFNIILSASALGLLFAGVKRIWGPLIALLCLAPLCVNPLLIVRAGGLRSETAYMFFSIAALWALSRSRPTTQALLVAAIAALLATLTRTVGVTLIAAIAILWLHQRRYKAVTILAGVSLLTVGAWLTWTFLAPQQHAGSNYIGDFVGNTGVEPPPWLTVLWRRTGLRLARYFGETVPWSLPMPTIPGTPIDNAVSSLTLVASLLAGVLVLARRWKVVGLYLVLYAAALMAWPFMRVRFVEPVLPLLVLAFLIGAGALVATVRPRWATPTIVVLSLMVTVTGAVRSAPRVARQVECGPLDVEGAPECLSPQQRSFLRSVQYISENTDPDDVFMTQMPETLYYYTGRQSIDGDLAVVVRPEAFLDYLAEQRVDWILLTAGLARFASGLWANCTELDVERIFHRRTILFRMPSGPVSEGERPARETAEACVALDDYLRDYRRDARGLAIE